MLPVIVTQNLQNSQELTAQERDAVSLVIGDDGRNENTKGWGKTVGKTVRYFGLFPKFMALGN